MDTLFASLHAAMYKKFGDNMLLLMWQQNLATSMWNNGGGHHEPGNTCITLMTIWFHNAAGPTTYMPSG